MSIGILGGGLSGISLQYFLDKDSEVLEKEDRAGGLCRTYKKDGFLFDTGGHILFSKNLNIMEFIRGVLTDNINYCRRNNKILFKDRYVKYPFENGIGVLDKQDIYECLTGYIENFHPKPKNFRQWIYYTFGEGIADKYLVPYNEKIWKTSLEKMSMEWVERVPRPPVRDIVKSALGIETEGYTHQLNFCYPMYDGIEGLVKTMLSNKKSVKTGYNIARIRRKKGEWVVSDGSGNRYYENIICTMPVMEAVKCLEDVPANVLDAVNSLKFNSVRVVLIGVNNESLMDKSAVYIPDKTVSPHRVCYMGYFSRHTVPEGKSSIIAETTTNSNTALHNASDDTLTGLVCEDLHRTGIIDKRDIVVTDIVNSDYAYVVYDTEYSKNIRIVRDYFDYIGIRLHGRFAEFEYINMDEVIKRSMKLAEEINTGKRE